MNLLLFKINHLGDNVAFLPVVQGLRACFPAARITVVTGPGEVPLYRGILPPERIFAPAPRDVFHHAWRRRPLALPFWALRIRQMRADASLLSHDQGNMVHLLAKHWGGEVRVGANMRFIRVKRSLTHIVPHPADWNVVRWGWDMARVLAQEISPGVAWPAEPPAPDLSHLVIKRVKRSRIVIHAGAKASIRQWPLQRYVELATRLSRDHEVVWVDRPETHTAQLPPDLHRETPASLSELATLLASARLFVGNNSGPMHIANAVGCHGLIISGPSPPGWDPYWHRERWRVLRHPALSCLPCERADVGQDHCINTETPLACMFYWDVDRVEAAARDLLARATAV